MHRRFVATRRGLVLAAAAVAVLPGCTGLGAGRTLRIDAAELQRMAAREFPLRRRVLEVIDLEVSAPRLGLLPERQRIAASVELSARERVFDARADGRLDFDAVLRWAAADQTLRLADVRVQRLELDSHGGRAPLPAERLAGLAAERALEGLVVWRLPPERAERLRRAGLTPERIEIETDALVVRFTDAPK
ncbi:hypothetical protein [Rubrivivax gelatinosus]|uniref:DUF1439 domain-containing protein n=1 Tax=Rubrivivax gelatinosus (strain NBRC 100245 / IL144) TaxID=983917 RepID=I0HV06_RUBGI|nr:hypothetical protein [Rubrivivax gelatinosus]BAL96843.1 hypothetical protein RGE_35040 [Rubrivivax gelatinosus IL144]